MEQASKDQPQVRRLTKAGLPDKRVKAVEPVTTAVNAEAIARAQAYALRIWNGQSPDLARADRLERVRRGLEAQGMSMEGVIL